MDNVRFLVHGKDEHAATSAGLRPAGPGACWSEDPDEE